MIAHERGRFALNGIRGFPPDLMGLAEITGGKQTIIERLLNRRGQRAAQ